MHKDTCSAPARCLCCVPVHLIDAPRPWHGTQIAVRTGLGSHETRVAYVARDGGPRRGAHNDVVATVRARVTLIRKYAPFAQWPNQMSYRSRRRNESRVIARGKNRLLPFSLAFSHHLYGVRISLTQCCHCGLSTFVLKRLHALEVLCQVEAGESNCPFRANEWPGM